MTTERAPLIGLDGLNPAQREAVEHVHGPLLVVAVGEDAHLRQHMDRQADSHPPVGGRDLLAGEHPGEGREARTAELFWEGDGGETQFAHAAEEADVVALFLVALGDAGGKFALGKCAGGVADAALILAQRERIK